MPLLRKIVVAVLSSLLFCLILAMLIYTPAAQRQQDTYYFPFFSLFMIYLIYAAPLYLLGGVPCSLLIDWCLRKMNQQHPAVRYLCGLLAYALAGAVVVLAFLLMFSGGDLFRQYSRALQLFLFGALASLLYYHIWLASFIFVKKVR